MDDASAFDEGNSQMALGGAESWRMVRSDGHGEASSRQPVRVVRTGGHMPPLNRTMGPLPFVYKNSLAPSVSDVF